MSLKAPTANGQRPTASFVFCLLVAVVTPLASQTPSSFVPLDHPLLPLFEHLVARGDVADPSPMVRPFRRGEALVVLSQADTLGSPHLAERVRRLAQAFDTLPAEAGWEFGGRAGFDAYTTPRRDLLRAVKDEGAMPYVEASGTLRFGRILAVSRPAIEPRLPDDPEWTGRRDLDIAGRMVGAYLSGQWRWVQVFYGQMERNWGPAGVTGIPLSGAGYGRTEIGLALGTESLKLTALASDLQPTTDSAGVVSRRFFFAHRLDARITRRLRLGLWETAIVAGEDREFDGRFRNPVSLLLLANQYGLGDKENNVMVGLDATWRVGRRLTLAAQLALDDLQYQNRSGPTRYPDRYAFTLSGSGALGGVASWRALYTQVSSLALRTFDPAQDFVDGGVGIGRTFDDYDQVSLSLGLPLGISWLVSPEATLIRQGEGRILDPVPPSRTVEAGNTPRLFIGTVERTWRLALGATGSRGPLSLNASAGFHHRVNADHIAGRTRDDFVARLFVTLGFTRSGTLR